MDTPAYEKVRLDRHVSGLGRFDQIVQDTVGDGFMERTFIPVAPEIELETFQFHAEFVGHITNTDRRKVRLTGLGTKACEFRALHLNVIIPSRTGIFEDLEFFRRLYWHRGGL